MRKLHIHRQRALACFAVPYYLFLKESLETDLAESSGIPIRNGQTIVLPLKEAETTCIVAIPNAAPFTFTNPQHIPAGSDDISCTILTEYDGYRQLGFQLQLNP